MRLDSNIHDDPKGKGRILLDGSLGSEGHLRSQQPIINGCGATIQAEKTVSVRDEISNPVYGFDDAVSCMRSLDQSLKIDSKHYRGLSPVFDSALEMFRQNVGC